tara:strand:- start:273 stop:473 length:201 start_codon:yes stop_codon:yes gene_type:complete
MQKSANKICGRCGSNYLISDRSLGGKLICVKCGSSFIKTKNFINGRNKKFIYLILIILVIFIIINI